MGEGRPQTNAHRQREVHESVLAHQELALREDTDRDAVSGGTDHTALALTFVHVPKSEG